MSVDRAGVLRVQGIIQPYVRRTPVIEVHGSEFGLGDFRLTLKLELFQHAGSFKSRGAFANLLLRKVPEAGVVAASGGNHGAAVAYAAMKLNVPAKIFVPTISSAAKIRRIRECNAELVIAGDRYSDALAASEQWSAQSGAMAIHAFDQVHTILGQGTLAAEIEAQCSNVDTVLVGVGGGGLIGGIAAWFGKRVRLVGVEPEASPTLSNALAAGGPVDAPADGYAADSLAPRRVGELCFQIARKFVKRVILVDDGAIRDAQFALWDRLRLVAEPGAAAALAALLSRRYVPATHEHVAVVISGGNTDAVRF
ncbi:MAG: threonine/serine dehydratase [Pseudomonadota bacterium]|nr:threonine/serine dehydratase [Pseudomonadota bacterium]